MNFEKGNTLAGSRKGIPNKFTNLRKSFLDAFEELGGVDGLVKWARDNRNRRDFYRMIAQMLPRHVEVNGGDHARQLAEIVGKADPKAGEIIAEALAKAEAEGLL